MGNRVMTRTSFVRRMAWVLVAGLLAAAGGAANATAFLGKQFETRYFDVSGSAQMCDIFNTADYLNCALTRREDFSRTISLERSFDVGWDPARGTLNSVTLFWSPVPIGPGVGLGPAADFKAGAKVGRDKVKGWLDVDTDFKFSLHVPDSFSGGTTALPIDHINIGDALDSCVPTQILIFVNFHCDLYEQQGVDLSSTSATYTTGGGASIADYFTGDAADPTVMMTMEYAATFHFRAEDLHNDELYTEGRYGEINVAGRYAIRYGYTPAGTPRSGPPGGGGPGDPEPPPTPTPVPLPSALAMMAAGVAGLLCWGRRQRPARGSAV